MPIKNYSTTPGNNTSAPPFGAPESSTKLKDFNDLARQIMADVRCLAAPVTIASAATTDLGASDETIQTISGTTTITSFGTVSAGIYKFVTFSGALTLTHNATSLILLGGTNRTTVAGDCGLYVSLGSGNWKEYFYSPIGGYQPLDAQLTTLAGITAQQAADLASLSPFIGTLLNDADAATATATLSALANVSPLVLSTDANLAGGRVRLEVPPNSTLAAGSVNLDIASQSLRIYESGGTSRGVNLDLLGAASSAGSKLWHSTNLPFATVSGTAPMYAPRAWVNFSGAGAVSIGGSGNATVTDNGVGDYTINFTTSMPDTKYLVTGMTTGAADGNLLRHVVIKGADAGGATNKTVSAVTIQVGATHAASLVDMAEINVAIIR